MKTTWPPYCGPPDCDKNTRMVETDDDRARRCPCVANATTHAELTAREAALELELGEVRRKLADLEAPGWVRGPGVRT